MFDTNKNTVILIRDATTLPPNLSIASNAFFPGWQIVTSPDRSTFTRGVEAAHWNFFYRANETRATVLGGASLRTLRRAVKQILGKQENQNFNFNSLEVTTIVSKRFLGIPFLRTVAHLRHIQESSALVPSKAFVSQVPSDRAAESGTSSGEPHGAVQYATAK
jgi:hypothetical protein